MFVTLLLGVLNLKTGILRYCNAGHTPPILVHPHVHDKSVCTQVELIPNLPVGAMKGFPYKEQSLLLPDSSILTLYTDGISEAENENKTPYGTKRLMETVEHNAHSSSRQMTEALLADLKLHVRENEPSDDVTLLVINYRKQPNERRQTIVISNKIEELHQVRLFIEEVGAQVSLTSDVILKLNLAMEEALSNIILYSFDKQQKEQQMEQQIEISVTCTGNEVIITLIDNGCPFNPTLKEAPDLHLSAAERSIGGLGIHIIQQIMDKVDYQRVNNQNILTMTKKIN